MKSASLIAACAAAMVSVSVASIASAQQAAPDPQPAPSSPPAATTGTTTTTTTTESTTTTTAPATTESATTTAPPPASPATTGPAPAASAPTFGQAGEIVLAYTHFWGWGGSDAAPFTNAGGHIYNGAFIDIHNTSKIDGPSSTQFTIQPSADYFVIDNLSVGAFVGFAWFKTGDTHATAFQIGPRIGYNIPISSMFSVWPKVGYSFQTITEKTKDPATGQTITVSGKAINASELDVYIPIMFHPAPHFFLGFGPAISARLNSNVLTQSADGTPHKPFSIGGQVSLGGYLGPL